MLHGCTSVLQEARRRAAPGTLTVLFAPRVESWTVQQQAATDDVDGEACSFGTSLPPLQGMQPLAMQLPHRSVGRFWPPVAQAPAFQHPYFVHSHHQACVVAGCSPTLGSARARPLQSFMDVQPAAEVGAAAAEQPVRQRQMQPSLAGPADYVGGCGDSAEAAASPSAATDAWALVEHALRSWPQGAPLLLLATCHVPLSTLPAQLSRRFASNGGQVRWSARQP